MHKSKLSHLMVLSSLFILSITALFPLVSFAEDGTAPETETTTTQQESIAEDIMSIARNAGYTVDDVYRPAASIVIEANSGQVIWADQADLAWYPASIAKMMTVYLVLDAIKEGKLTLDTQVTATESDAAISQIYELSNTTIVAGAAYPVTDLLYMTTLASSNAATVMLANLITSNDAAAFITMMNEKAKTLGMTNTTFYNPSGAAASAFNGYYVPEGIDPEADNTSTARDLALMFYHLLKDHPEVLEYTNKFQVTVMENTEYAEVLENSNRSIPGSSYGYEGEDGLKTGASPEAAFNYAATAKRGDMRLIEVVLGVGSWEDPESENYRHIFGNALFDYGFNNFEYKIVLPAGTQTVNNKEIILEQDFYGLLRKGTQPEFILSDNQQLLLSNQLEKVSPSLPAPSISYQEKKTENTDTVAADTGADKEGNNAASPTSFVGKIRQRWKEYAISIVFLILSILLLIYSQTKSSKLKQTRKRATARKQTAFILGVTCLLIAVAAATFTFVAGQWLPF
ncbi:DUF1958 domain-containing protein [Enterococcus sp. BWB1-3]|uniref:DUF1958 domain-containing protein n=1 Tax=Enterococcus sp. BWB1-3 TaxID=2787713 RepID=UPI001F22734D|nr:DUF1958 domain-containing protein [Enterococcus sp. BWB1-3]